MIVFTLLLLGVVVFICCSSMLAFTLLLLKDHLIEKKVLSTSNSISTVYG